MHNVLLILLHRPFVSDGDLHSSPSNAINSFLVCATAATMIVKILRAYDAAFSIQRAPYLISYATYVSATIHVRIAAQRDAGSEAHDCLATCLSVFKKNQETNWAVRKANLIIQNLMKRMHVNVNDSNIISVTHGKESGAADDERPLSPEPADAPQNCGRNQRPQLSDNVTAVSQSSTMVPNPCNMGMLDYVASDLNIDAIIQSFIREQQSDRHTIQGTREDPTTANPWLHSVSHVQDNITTNDPHTNMVNLPGDAYGLKFPHDRFSTQFLADDMLFGFNSSEIEGIGWEFDSRIF